ncbi:hypothetical protein A2U01_0054199, partial [Trifolium medium]|nr:hypothetical protein [Trifolium medium]
DLVVFNLQISRRRQVVAGGAPVSFPATVVAAFGSSIFDQNLQSKVFGPSGRNGGVSFAKKWPQSRVSRVTALFL